jgi:hypothetical protein
MKAVGCENRFCERVDRRVPERATHLLGVTWPVAAARANPPQRLCATCAGDTAKAYAGFGWSVQLERISARGAVRGRAAVARQGV